jgi:hypothetical protein
MSSWPKNGLSDLVSTTLARVYVGNLSRHGATKEVAKRVAREMTDRPIAPANNLLAVSARVLGTDAQGRITGKLKSVEEYGRGFGDEDQSLTLLSKFKTYEQAVDTTKRKNRFRMEETGGHRAGLRDCHRRWYRGWLPKASRGFRGRSREQDDAGLRRSL